jgi:hypothetical protein
MAMIGTYYITGEQKTSFFTILVTKPVSCVL